MKLSNEKEVKRLVIYFFYDADGIVDRYVPYMLEDINKNCSELFVVVNGKLTKEGRETFKALTPNLLVRENKGYDVWAYKAALEHYGWEKLKEYEEVVLMNFTQFGPLYPFSEMFFSMNERDVDFWGITKHHGFPFDPFGTIPCGYIPEHIQSSFICIRKSMLNSCEFHDYWDKMPEVKSYGEAVGKHEAIFTKLFEDFGFVSDVYVNTEDLKDYTHYPLMLDPVELIKNRKCPVFKRKSFTNEYFELLNASLGEPTVELYKFIQKNNLYDLDMVWENLLRTDNLADIKNRMHLNYILPYDYKTNPENEKKYKIALVIHIYFEDNVDFCFDYIHSMPETADIFITSPLESTIIAIKKKVDQLKPRHYEIIKVENRGRDVSALLIGAKKKIVDYDLVCFAHDKKSQQMLPYSVGQSFSYKCFENVLGSAEYVSNIISAFAREQRLGMMFPPPPNHGGYYGMYGCEWGSNYLNTLNLASDLKLKTNINEMKEPISPLGTMFWFRPNALSPLLKKEWKYTDFPKEPNSYDGSILHAIERIYSFVAQSEGFYSAWCMHDQFAAIEITNLHFMIREMSMRVYAAVGHQSNFNEALYSFTNKISLRKMFKVKVKSVTPAPIWNSMRKTYHKFGGKRWIG